MYKNIQIKYSLLFSAEVSNSFKFIGQIQTNLTLNGQDQENHCTVTYK